MVFKLLNQNNSWSRRSFRHEDRHVVHKNMVGGSSMILIPLIIVDFEQDVSGIDPGPLGWHTRALTNDVIGFI